MKEIKFRSKAGVTGMRNVFSWNSVLGLREFNHFHNSRCSDTIEDSRSKMWTNSWQDQRKTSGWRASMFRTRPSCFIFIYLLFYSRRRCTEANGATWPTLIHWCVKMLSSVEQASVRLIPLSCSLGSEVSRWLFAGGFAREPKQIVCVILRLSCWHHRALCCWVDSTLCSDSNLTCWTSATSQQTSSCGSSAYKDDTPTRRSIECFHCKRSFAPQFRWNKSEQSSIVDTPEVRSAVQRISDWMPNQAYPLP